MFKPCQRGFVCRCVSSIHVQIHANDYSFSTSGALTLLVTNPIWVVKTRLCLQYEKADVPAHKQYKGMVDCFHKIYKYEGFRGLYKVREFFSAQFASYECHSEITDTPWAFGRRGKQKIPLITK